jgi:hypothetical protein
MMICRDASWYAYQRAQAGGRHRPHFSHEPMPVPESWPVLRASVRDAGRGEIGASHKVTASVKYRRHRYAHLAGERRVFLGQHGQRQRVWSSRERTHVHTKLTSSANVIAHSHRRNANAATAQISVGSARTHIARTGGRGEVPVLGRL